jgi:hypothetical protein
MNTIRPDMHVQAVLSAPSMMTVTGADSQVTGEKLALRRYGLCGAASPFCRPCRSYPAALSIFELSWLCWFIFTNAGTQLIITLFGHRP